MTRALLLLLLLAGRAAAEPVRIHVACEVPGRTKACPAFLLGFLDHHAALRAAPRSDADVVLYASATAVALADRVHLRFVTTLAGAPPVIEVDATLDTRASDDDQRAQLEPAFLRGVALLVAARDPALVTVTLAEPAQPRPAIAGSPWDLAVDLSGFASWTRQYQSYTGSATLSAARLTPRTRLAGNLYVHGGVDRQPALALDDGTQVSLDATEWQLGASLHAARLLDDHWSYGGVVRALRDDPDGQYSYNAIGKLALGWDRYRADDPRGNRLAVSYAAGYQADGYRLRNVLGERAADYPVHGVLASAGFRIDQVTVGLALQLASEVLHPARRHTLSASPSIEWQLGAHVDLHLTFSITRRALPAPDPAAIDPNDYAQQSRLSYAESLSMSGTFSVTFHVDRSNGVRNDRLSDL